MFSWEILESACKTCNRCRLAENRTNVVVGDGNRNAKILLIGEGPGEKEDLSGVPFVGPAGQLLDKMLKCIDLTRDDVYIANVVKCRPPGNRDPETDEKNCCIEYLRYQFALIKPDIIICLGRIAAQSIINSQFRITKEHGIWYKKKNCWMIATYHPSALLRDASKKKFAFEDLKEIKKKIDELGINGQSEEN